MMRTTKEAAEKLVHDRQVNALNDLLIKNYDSEKGYKEALAETNDALLKENFKVQAARRSQYINELDKAVRDLNAVPAASGSAIGVVHRAWIDFKTAFIGKSNDDILEECRRGDKIAVSEYEEVLTDSTLSINSRQTLISQLNSIQKSLTTINTLEETKG